MNQHNEHNPNDSRPTWRGQLPDAQAWVLAVVATPEVWEVATTVSYQKENALTRR